MTKISVFDQNFGFWPKLRFLTKISIFSQNSDFWPKFRFLTKISLFNRNFDCWPKFRICNKKSIFDQYLFYLNRKYTTKIQKKCTEKKLLPFHWSRAVLSLCEHFGYVIMYGLKCQVGLFSGGCLEERFFTTPKRFFYTTLKKCFVSLIIPFLPLSASI